MTPLTLIAATGFGVFIGLPILIVLMLITLIGIPLALLSIALYIASTE